jgi:DNA-binding PadR family transcriptional regulator
MQYIFEKHGDHIHTESHETPYPHGAHCHIGGHREHREHRQDRGWRGFGRHSERGDHQAFEHRFAERGFGRGRHGGPERGFGHTRERLFDAGDIKLVILKLLAEQPSYGYQLIKTMEQRLAGGYTPSAGVIYPTLTLLEEEGLATATSENNKKVYAVTPEGLAFLEANKPRVDQLFDRLEEAGRGFERGRSPELMKAFGNLRGAVMARMARGNAKPEQIQKIAEAINAAAKTIDEL